MAGVLKRWETTSERASHAHHRDTEPRRERFAPRGFAEPSPVATAGEVSVAGLFDAYLELKARNRAALQAKPLATPTLSNPVPVAEDEGPIQRQVLDVPANVRDAVFGSRGVRLPARIDTMKTPLNELIAFVEALEDAREDETYILEQVPMAARPALQEAIGELTFPINRDVYYEGPLGLHERGLEGAITVFEPLNENELDLSQLAGTHQSVARSFGDETHTVEGTADEIVGNPDTLRNEAFRLTVFRATAPGRPDGPALIWSMNNRRVKAMQLAGRRLRRDLRVLVKWASIEDLNYAIGPGKFNNVRHGEVDFTQASDNQQRVMRHLAAGSARPVPPQLGEMTNEQVSNLSAEELAKLFDL